MGGGGVIVLYNLTALELREAHNIMPYIIIMPYNDYKARTSFFFSSNCKIQEIRFLALNATTDSHMLTYIEMCKSLQGR